MSREDREGDGLVPGDLFYGVAGVDFYRDLLHSLETVGHFELGKPGLQIQHPSLQLRQPFETVSGRSGRAARCGRR